MPERSPYGTAADLYDFTYEHGNFRDYDAETSAVHHVIEQLRPGSQTVLDAGCATGEHARRLSQQYLVDGIDIEPEFIKRAQAKNPKGSFRVADLRDFKMDKKYDVILCLSGTTGYLRTPEALKQTMTGFSCHLGPDGVVLVEPWFIPDAWRPGSITMVTAETSTKKVCRMVRTEQEGRLSVLYFNYLIGTPNKFTTRSERHELALFSKDETLEAFATSGLTAHYDPDGLGENHGLYIGKKNEN